MDCGRPFLLLLPPTFFSPTSAFGPLQHQLPGTCRLPGTHQYVKLHSSTQPLRFFRRHHLGHLCSLLGSVLTPPVQQSVTQEHQACVLTVQLGSLQGSHPAQGPMNYIPSCKTKFAFSRR
uniref:Uncharacterized protein n=1 Tax=Eutreptiella gymnastica TaxID=73025 RepID=A0A7S1IMJ1_9EUGL